MTVKMNTSTLNGWPLVEITHCSSTDMCYNHFCHPVPYYQPGDGCQAPVNDESLMSE